MTPRVPLAQVADLGDDHQRGRYREELEATFSVAHEFASVVCLRFAASYRILNYR
jgi:hypothetical protein